MAKAILIVIVFVGALGIPVGNLTRPSIGYAKEQTTAPESPVKITIASVGSSLGPVTKQYKVGDQIIVTFTMTNTSTQPTSVCISSDLYQALPKLTKAGQLIPYLQWESYERLNAQRNQTCKEFNLPETILLKPNEPKAVDWLVLVDDRTATGAEAWYDSLSPGKYELSIQRRLGCCDGTMIDSNKISFDVLP